MNIPPGTELSAAITMSQLITEAAPLGLALLFSFAVDEAAAKSARPEYNEYKLVKLVKERLPSFRLAGLALVALFFFYKAVEWYNRDMAELNAIAVGTTQVGKEYQRREDLARNLENVVNNYASHERVLFEYVSDMRAMLQAMGGSPSGAQSAKLEGALMNLSALAEQYPDLKAEQQFSELMNMAEISEDRIAEKLSAYIEAILDYNTCNQHFWCNYWTFFGIAQLVPMPAFFEYYFSDSKYTPAVPVMDRSAQPAMELEKDIRPAD